MTIPILLLAFATTFKLAFTVEATEDASRDFPGAPRVQSFSFGQWQGRWVIIGGRMAGYHGVGGGQADFLRADANRSVWVIDTTQKPARTYCAPLSQLPDRFMPVKDEWSSAGQLFYQDGSKLYIAGGYGQDHAGNWITYPVISRVDLPRLINSVISGYLDSSAIEFSESDIVQSAGGEIIKLSDSYFYLVMGHVFTGSYTAFEGQGEHNAHAVSQDYLNEIRKLKIVSGPNGSLTVSSVQTFKDAVQFHRRDLNVMPMIGPQGLGLAIFGGVFTPETQLAYSKPIYLEPASEPVIETVFEQKMNAYTCARMSLYDPAGQTMYTTFFGGISRYFWDPVAGAFIENPKIGSKSDSTYFDGMQWSDQISTIKRVMSAGREETSEAVHPTSLPAFVGTSAVFIPAPGIHRVRPDADVLDFGSLRGKTTFIGYVYGGIRAMPFRFPYSKTSQPYNSGAVPTVSSDLILRVYLKAQ